jgi:hypothetical protein
VLLARRRSPLEGNWVSAIALFGYAAAFSFAYVTLPAGPGALQLFGAVQTTMILSGLRSGEGFGIAQGGGLILAVAGLVGLVLPGVAAPPLLGALLMAGAGVAWGVQCAAGVADHPP